MTDAAGRTSNPIPHPIPHPITRLVPVADQALVRTVDGLPDESYAAGSLLPGWTRGHVVAHLALNAEALAAVLHGAHLGEPPPMYASVDARDADIEELAAAGPSVLRERLLAGTGRFAEAMEAMHDGDWEGSFERTPGGPGFRVTAVPLMRVRELEIHHVDLDAGYSPADWPEEFRALMLDSMTQRHHPTPFVVRPTDLDGTWAYGEGGGGPVVSGTSYDLGWWLTGRGTGEGLTSDNDELPEIESW